MGAVTGLFLPVSTDTPSKPTVTTVDNTILRTLIFFCRTLSHILAESCCQRFRARLWKALSSRVIFRRQRFGLRSFVSGSHAPTTGDVDCARRFPMHFTGRGSGSPKTFPFGSHVKVTGFCFLTVSILRCLVSQAVLPFLAATHHVYPFRAISLWSSVLTIWFFVVISATAIGKVPTGHGFTWARGRSDDVVATFIGCKGVQASVFTFLMLSPFEVIAATLRRNAVTSYAGFSQGTDKKGSYKRHSNER